ncbi:ATP-binding protein [Lunatimonas salinarum]|uniref:ATP-binding protein n=1 Tax=Lunatimonas salinarum TaxID=1774590 RepID=UPI001ADF1299|nr:ATP-binding protein [Lunatimonas salinarum]
MSFEQLHIYYQEKKKPLNKQFKRNLELLTPQGDANYAAYLLADENKVSVKVAKYQGDSRVDLVESNEYGYVSLVKATKSVLDKIALENRTITLITSKERKEKPLWNAIALREAIINAFVHNDYTREIAPKFEIFKDRLEITSAGSLPEGLSESEFFEGFSIPRNKELMRIFKDLDLVEQLGSGIPRILEAYGKDCFQFSENFLRMVFPASSPVHTTEQVTEQAGLVKRLVKDLVKELPDTQIKILNLVSEDEHITKSAMARQIGTSTTTIDNHIDALKNKNILQRIGGRKKGYWQIIEQE